LTQPAAHRPKYGDAFVNGYRKLFGLPALSGAALKAAATVGQNAK
jgi:hypothetical protein